MKNCFVADFETTTNENDCRVWGWGLYNIIEDIFNYGNTIETFFTKIFTLPDKTKLYFHNLKFDGEFIFYYLFKNNFVHKDDKKLYDYEFRTLISHMGVFYAIELCYNGKLYTIYDSLKIIPLQVSKISKSFGLSQLKGDIDYHKERDINYYPSKEEISYIKNDVEIVGKALASFFNQGLNKMTQASNAFSDYKKILTAKRFDKLFPSINTIDNELRQSYKGGFTYLKPELQGKDLGHGIVLDVNSLYPATMYFCKLPYGEPLFYNGKYDEDKIYDTYIQMFRCNFELKKGFLPTLQLKKNSYFRCNNDYVTSSDNTDITLCMTNVDLELFLKHYEVYNIEYFNGWKFKSSNKLFTDYIDKWIKIKEEATITGNEGLRTLAKLMLNALYGKFGLNPIVKSKFPTFDGEYVSYSVGETNEREPIFLPVASFVTAYARKTTIEAGQKNFDRFIYSDTDSLHLLGLNMPNNIEIDPIKLGAWKHEGNFNKSRFVRSKSYIENIFITNDEWQKLNTEKQSKWLYNEIDNIYEQLHIACAGLPTKCHENITFENFKNGLVVPGKLQHKRVKGGVILKEIDFTINL